MASVVGETHDLTFGPCRCVIANRRLCRRTEARTDTSLKSTFVNSCRQTTNDNNNNDDNGNNGNNSDDGRKIQKSKRKKRPVKNSSSLLLSTFASEKETLR
ncbi:hypothetical protein F2P81_005333 [Scophthalmus maximus]|uniref:Uncharacterized protein n=1 Tax=Scophthalmus maximus TaxID=52904 RepID=A0A6A4TG10_SCOMX|nr:hypothetical protein F2P81_005333 [Scophthalmus maximus]